MSKVFAFLLLLSLPLAVSAEDALPATVEEVDARIQSIESDLIKAQAERFRAKHKLEYGDPDAAPKYKEAKAMEGELIDLRKKLDERLMVLDESIRTLDAQVGAQHKELGEMRQLADAIHREIALSAMKATNQADPLTLSLNQELEQAQAQILALKTNASETAKILQEKKKTVAATDKEAGQIEKNITKLEKTYEASFGDLQQTLDGSEAIKALDKKRMELVQEIQRLREHKLRLIEAATAP